jgi:hypothetical protein
LGYLGYGCEFPLQIPHPTSPNRFMVDADFLPNGLHLPGIQHGRAHFDAVDFKGVVPFNSKRSLNGRCHYQQLPERSL